MRQVEATTTKQGRRTRTAVAPAQAGLGNVWLASPVPGFAMRPTAMHAEGVFRPPEAPT